MRSIVSNLLLISFTLVLFQSCLPKGIYRGVVLNPRSVTLTSESQSVEVRGSIYYQVYHAYVGYGRNNSPLTHYYLDPSFYKSAGSISQEGLYFKLEENGNYSFLLEDWFLWEYDCLTGIATVSVTENTTRVPRYAEVRANDGVATDVFYLTQAVKDDN